ncbi:MAG TPA: isochorismatase family cysteine hydrolase [Nocardioidaceae bacterium]|nr:isochorismatase family cysteine hydrolase [Nocardioidaceae bacterium]
MTDYTSIHWERAALLIIDTQTDFVDGAMPIPGTAELLGNMAAVADAFRDAGRPIVHVIRYYEPFGSDVDTLRRAAVEAGAQIAAPDSTGADIPALLTQGQPVTLDASRLLTGEQQEISPSEVVIYKPRWSAFHRTRLEEWLKQNDVDTVVVAGCNLPNCPRATLFDASQRDFRTGLVTDAVSQATDERVADLTLIGVNLLTVTDVCAALGGAAD